MIQFFEKKTKCQWKNLLLEKKLLNALKVQNKTDLSKCRVICFKGFLDKLSLTFLSHAKIFHQKKSEDTITQDEVAHKN